MISDFIIKSDGGAQLLGRTRPIPVVEWYLGRPYIKDPDGPDDDSDSDPVWLEISRAEAEFYASCTSGHDARCVRALADASCTSVSAAGASSAGALAADTSRTAAQPVPRIPRGGPPGEHGHGGVTPVSLLRETLAGAAINAEPTSKAAPAAKAAPPTMETFLNNQRLILAAQERMASDMQEVMRHLGCRQSKKRKRETLDYVTVRREDL